jgi:toxin CcdB
MPQFDVHRSPGRNRQAIPFVVVVQSRRFDQLASRVVIPLVAVRTEPLGEGLRLTPTFTIAGKLVYLNPLEIQTVPRSSLGRRIAALADDESSTTIINAIDAMITRAYG